MPAIELDEIRRFSTSALRIKIDLREQIIIAGTEEYSFNIDAHCRNYLLDGLDEIFMTLSKREKIDQFEQAHRLIQPWLFERDTRNIFDDAS